MNYSLTRRQEVLRKPAIPRGPGGESLYWVAV